MFRHRNDLESLGAHFQDEVEKEQKMKNRINGTYACILLVTVLGLAGAARAAPTTITFDEFPLGTPIKNQYARDGVRFLAGTVTPRLPQVSMNLAMPDQPVLRAVGEPDYDMFQGDFWMEFVQPVSRVEFQSGYWNQVGTGIIRVYSPTNNLVGTFSNTQTGPETISIAGLGPIGKIYFNSVADGAGLDNLSFTAIPAPGALLLVGLGTGVVGWLRRKRALA